MVSQPFFHHQSRAGKKMGNRQAIDYLAELGRERCATLIAEKRAELTTTTNEIGCWLYGGSRNTDGYSQVWVKPNSRQHLTGRAAQKAFLMHRVAYVARHGRDVEGHGSHLCNNRDCFRPDHIVDESAVDNNSRKGCSGVLVCGWHHHILADLCIHVPKCLRPERYEGLSCCLALKESDPEGWISHPPSEMSTDSTMYSDLDLTDMDMTLLG